MLLTTYSIHSDILQNAPFRSQIFKNFFASGGRGALTPLTKILRTPLAPTASARIVRSANRTRGTHRPRIRTKYEPMLYMPCRLDPSTGRARFRRDHTGGPAGGWAGTCRAPVPDISLTDRGRAGHAATGWAFSRVT